MADEQALPVNNKKKKAAAVFVVILIIGALTLFFYLRYKSVHISTDDAFVDGRIHTIAPKIRGTVKTVYVNDNQQVKKGDLLLEVDTEDYDAKVDEASSGLAAQRSKVVQAEAAMEVASKQRTQLKAAVESAKAELELQKAYLQQAERDMKRAESLFKEDILSKERYEKIQTDNSVAVARVKAAAERLKQAEAAIEAHKAIFKQAEAIRNAEASGIKKDEAILRTAKLNQGYTKIYAPEDGYITKKSVQPGNQIQPGQPLMAVVSLDDIWITANYKETQLTKIKHGQKVTVKVDTYPGKEFIGKVDSIMSGTGAVFSLFPPENATGNFVKVVQRIPVKIVLDKDSDKNHILRIGMSAEPTVIVEK
jgi:membrane fusion protein (multidrug efflux system)